MKMCVQVLAIVVAVSFGAATEARGDDVVHFLGGIAPGQFPDVSTVLDNVGIGSNNVGSETTASSFSVPGVGNADLTFAFERDTGSFLFNFGYFDSSGVTANPVTEKQLWATQALLNATLVFDDQTDNPGATSTHTVAGGAELGFFLIPNNTLANFNADPGDFYPSQTADSALRSPLFSASDANPGELDQMLSFVGNGATLFTFEDLTRTGASDQDFTDLAFTIDVELEPTDPVVPEASTFAVWLLLGLCLTGARWHRRKRSL